MRDITRAALRGLAATLALSVPVLGADGPPAEGWRRDGFRLEHASGARIGLTGYVQGDLRSPRDVFVADDEEAGLDDTVTDVHRLRIGIDGEWKRLSFQAQVDPQDEGEHLKDLWAEVRLHKGLRIRAGHQKVPVSRDFLTSASRLDFVDRNLAADHLGPGRDWGVVARGEPLDRVDYIAGVFVGDGGAATRSRSETTVAGRLVVSPWRPLELGGSFSQGDVEAQPAGGDLDPTPLGLVGEGPSGFRFYEPHFTNGTRRRIGADARVARGPVALVGEWLRVTAERTAQGSVGDDLPPEVGTGWSVSATWLVTGEKKDRTIEPDRPVFSGGVGAVELAARYEELAFDDDGPEGGFAGAGNRARNIRPVADRVITAGLSWWPAGWMRLMGNVALERFDDPLLAPEPGRRGEYVTILGRLQFQLP
jgi:phosphate-selective porin